MEGQFNHQPKPDLARFVRRHPLIPHTSIPAPYLPFLPPYFHSCVGRNLFAAKPQLWGISPRRVCASRKRDSCLRRNGSGGLGEFPPYLPFLRRQESLCGETATLEDFTQKGLRFAQKRFLPSQEWKWGVGRVSPYLPFLRRQESLCGETATLGDFTQKGLRFAQKRFLPSQEWKWGKCGRRLVAGHCKAEVRRRRFTLPPLSQYTSAY